MKVYLNHESNFILVKFIVANVQTSMVCLFGSGRQNVDPMKIGLLYGPP